MSIKSKLEKSAKSISMFSNLAGPLLGSILPMANSNVYFNIEDGTGYTLTVRDLEAEVIEDRIEPVTLELIGKEEAFMELFEGRSLPSLWVNGLITIKGVRNNLLNALVIGMVLSI